MEWSLGVWQDERFRPLSFRQRRFRVGRVSSNALNIFNNIFLVFTDVLINIIEKIFKRITDGSCQRGGKMKCVGDRMVNNLFQGTVYSVRICLRAFLRLRRFCVLSLPPFVVSCGVGRG